MLARALRRDGQQNPPLGYTRKVGTNAREGIKTDPYDLPQELYELVR